MRTPEEIIADWRRRQEKKKEAPKTPSSNVFCFLCRYPIIDGMCQCAGRAA